MKKAVLLTLSVLLSFVVRTQQVVPSLSGTDFWVSFMPNYDNVGAHYIWIASAEDCTVHIVNADSSWSTTTSVAANQVKSVYVPRPDIQTVYGGRRLNCSWHITTSAPASVYASNFISASHDITAILPTSTLRREYMTQSYDAGSNQEVAIVAPYDSTRLQFDLAGNLLDPNNYTVIHGGQTRHVTLMRGDVYLLQGRQGLDGCRFAANKPIAVFQGHVCATVPYGSAACDHLYEQCIPTEYWGQHFVLMPTTDRSVYRNEIMDSLGNIIGYGDTAGNCMGDMVRVTALNDNCVVTVGDRVADTLAAGESYHFLLANRPQEVYGFDFYQPIIAIALGWDFYQSDALPVNTSEPATVSFYISGTTFGGTPGDPAMVVVPPIEQGVHHAVVAAYNTGRTHSHYLNILAPDRDTSLVTIDGQSIASDFTPTADGISWARLVIDTGVHVVDADSGRFVATFYGLGDAESYAYIASTALRKINYFLQADRYSVCPGDTVCVAVRFDNDSLSMSWELDGIPLATTDDSIRVVLDSVGQHYVTGTISPLGIEKTACIIVNPVYSGYEADTVCAGDSLLWHGQWVTSGGLPLADTLQTVAGCDSIVSLQLTVLNVLRPSFTLETDCEHYRYSILGTFVGDTTGYALEWQATPPDATLAGQPWDSLSLSPSTTTTYRFAIEGRCPFDTSFILQPISWPVADMTVRPERLSIEHPSFEAYDQSRNATSRQWWVDSRYAGDDPILYYTANIMADSLLLTLVAANEACVDTLTRVLPIDHSVVWVPNVFTPDGTDNNFFAPVFNEGVAEELYIYNRQGLLVAHIEGENPSWDGTREGTPCSQGAYVWVLYYRTDRETSKLQKLTGTVLLLK